MLLTDYHVHSDVSQDSSASMYDMAAAEAAMGIELMCFTNHCDMCHWRDYTFNPRCLTAVPETFRKFEEMKAEHGLPLEIRLGLELGEPLFAPDTAREIAQSPGLDFVIGSLHILQGIGDLWMVRFASMEHCLRTYDLYLDELIKTAELDFFDVMAHIGYVRRYMWRQGFDAEMSLDLYGEKIRRLLRRLIDNGRGIEINCSGIRDGCGPFPQPEVLSLYRELGGRIITVGSDAHSPQDAAKCVREGYQVLRDCGFDRITVFKNHQPEFIKI
ncbi:MAG: histidinol-phosphatase HisJ family protein [Oscillospiraceae bacterium]